MENLDQYFLSTVKIQRQTAMSDECMKYHFPNSFKKQ